MDKLVADANDIREPNGVRAERHLQFRNGAEGLDGGIHVARISKAKKGVSPLSKVTSKGYCRLSKPNWLGELNKDT